MSLWNPTELRELADAYVAGSLDAEKLQRLQEVLLAEEQARVFFLGYVDVHAGLQWKAQRGELDVAWLAEAATKMDGVGGAVAAVGATSHWWRRGRVLPVVTSLAAAVLVVLGVLRWITPVGPEVGSGEAPALLTVSESLHGSLLDGEALQIGRQFSAGPLELRSGLVEFRTASGTILLLQGPARFEILDGLRGRLYSGNLVVRMPKGRSGFVVETPKMRVTDLGTEFGVAVADGGESQVQVYEGEVRAESTITGGEKRLKAGQAMRSEKGGGLVEDAASPNSFVRRFPPPAFPTEPGGTLFNTSVVEVVQVAVASTPVVIDGDLSEWTPAKPFQSACAPPYHASYFVEGRMMYDANNLYLAAHVGDPDPMCNRAGGIMDFAGGSVIVRVSTDRNLGWPLKGSQLDAHNKKAPPLPDSVSQRVTSLILSYDKSAEQPRLRLQHGFIFTPSAGPRPPEGWKGQFRMDTDGRGYTLEYAIPWRLLNCAEDPPRAGDSMAALWMVHWSDANGRVCRGQLVDVTSPQSQARGISPTHFFLHGPTWGRAEYLPVR